jgi:tetratricopeptide (TPR) repeat protein
MEALNVAAIAATQLGEYQKAVALYEQALFLQGETPEVYHNIGLLHAHMGDHKGAVKIYREALALDQNSAEIYVSLANSLGETGQVEAALAAYDEALPDCSGPEGRTLQQGRDP